METMENQMSQTTDKPDPTGKYKKLLAVMTIIILALIAAVVVLFIQMNSDDTDDSSETDTENTQTENQDESEDSLETESVTSVEESSIASLDSEMNVYTNNEFGYSISFPKMMNHAYGNCIDDGDSARPDRELVPVVVIEDEDKSSAYIVNEYSYVLSGEELQADSTYNYSHCDKTDTAISQLGEISDQYNIFWKLESELVEGESDIESFVQDKYGSGCSIGSLDATSTDGVFDVVIQGDGLDLGESECPINYLYEMKYNESTGVLVSWNVGQSVSFIDESNTAYDETMIESFAFVE
jgi:hypothetical protein